jgi:hypothetical protein
LPVNILGFQPQLAPTTLVSFAPVTQLAALLSPCCQGSFLPATNASFLHVTSLAKVDKTTGEKVFTGT